MNFEVLRRITDGPTIVAVIAFVPPAIQDADIQRAIHACFLAARSASLEWRSRIVHPNIDALSKEMRGMNLIVLDERNVSGHAVVGGQRIDLMDEMLSMFVRWMRFSCEDNLDRFPLIQHHRLDPIQIME